MYNIPTICVMQTEDVAPRAPRMAESAAVIIAKLKEENRLLREEGDFLQGLTKKTKEVPAATGTCAPNVTPPPKKWVNQYNEA